MKTKITTREIVYSDGGVTISADGFVKVRGFALGTLNSDGTLSFHVRRRCKTCTPPKLNLCDLAALGAEFGV